MARPKAIFSGLDEGSIGGIDDRLEKAAREIYNNDEFIEAAFHNTIIVRTSLDSEKQSLKQPDKLCTIDELIDTTLYLEKAFYNLPSKIDTLVDLHCDQKMDQKLNEVINYLKKLNVSLTTARQEKYFTEPKLPLRQIQTKFSIQLAARMIPLFLDHEIDMASTSNETKVSSGIMLLKILGESAGLFFSHSTWRDALTKAKQRT